MHVCVPQFYHISKHTSSSRNASAAVGVPQRPSRSKVSGEKFKHFHVATAMLAKQVDERAIILLETS
jgi:hypothetical protein